MYDNDPTTEISRLIQQKHRIAAEIEILKLRMDQSPAAPEVPEHLRKRVLTTQEVLEYTGLDISPRTLYRMVKRGEFPAREKPLGNWLRSEVDAWIDDPDKGNKR